MSAGYPDQVPGFKGSVATGRLGAELFAPKMGARQREALDALRAGGAMTADDVATKTGRHWYVVRPRISELKAMGLVVATGETRPSPFGGKTHVVRLATEEERASFQAAKASEGAHD